MRSDYLKYILLILVTSKFELAFYYWNNLIHVLQKELYSSVINSSGRAGIKTVAFLFKINFNSFHPNYRSKLTLPIK